LALGAEGVEIGTRFLATRQSPVPEIFKDRLESAPCTGTVLLGRGRRPSRVLKNKASEYLLEREAEASSEEARPFKFMAWDDQGATADNAIIAAGQVTGLIRGIEDVSAVIEQLVRGSGDIFSGLKDFFQA